MGRRCMKQNRKDGAPGRSHRIEWRPPATTLEGEGDAADRQPRYTEAMTERATEIMQKALSLSEEERADLACSLMDSLDATVDDDAESAWEQEIARRIADLDSGRAKTVSWEEVRGRISSKLPHGKQGS